MVEEEIEIRIRKILSNILEGGEDNIGLNDDIRDLGLNSTGILKLIINLEEEFDFEIRDDDFDFENFQTLKKLIVYIQNNDTIKNLKGDI